MSKTMNWPARAVYIVIALALALSLAMVAAPKAPVGANPGKTEWTPVTTPSEKNDTIVPGSNLYDFAVGPDGDTIYVIGEMPVGRNAPLATTIIALWKSTDGGATWSDKTSKLLKANVKLGLPAEFALLTQVAVSPSDGDFVAVAGRDAAGNPMVVGSTNGATKFYYTDTVSDGVTGNIICMDVSQVVEDVYNIAIGTSTGKVWRYEAGTYWGSTWKDATGYGAGWKASTAVTSVAFSPNWPGDKTVLVISTKAGETWLQTGKWGGAKGWGGEVSRPGAVEFKVETNSVEPIGVFPGVTGMALPSDYNGYEGALCRVYAYVDTESLPTPKPAGGYLFRIDGPVLSLPCGPTNHPWLSSIAYYGDHDTGDAMLGMLANGAPGALAATDCCTGVQVWRTDSIDVCCPTWHSAAKKPSGQAYALVAFTPDGNKAYATTQDDGLCGESAFSVSLDNGKCWNQLGLIDTDIDLLSDMAVSPDCSVNYLSSINIGSGCDCDSVWMKDANADEYADVWQRVYHKALINDMGLLRLSPDHEDGDKIVWGDQNSDKLFWAESKGICSWHSLTSTKNIQDFALADDDTIYVINNASDIVKWTPNDWHPPVDTAVTAGHTIAVQGDYILIGGGSGSVSYSDDAADSFSRLGDKGFFDGEVHVAFDSYFSSNDTVYAAVNGGKAGIWRHVIGKPGPAWKNLNADIPGEDDNYFGILLSYPDGNPMTNDGTGGVLYAAYNGGVARCLTPAKETCCGGWSWDFLEAQGPPGPLTFTLEPSSLKMCGCLTSSSFTNLFAIDNNPYAIADGKGGNPWTYEDCFAKAGVTLKGVKDGATVAADPCECTNGKFVLTWDRMCNACEYEFQISLDKDFTQIVRTEANYKAGPGGFYDPPSNSSPSVVIGAGDLNCSTQYFWRVRAHYAETGETIASWWSDAWSFTVEAGPGAAIGPTAPDDGASNVALTGIGFTWTSVADATSYDFVLSASADLSSPIDSKTGLKGTAYTFGGELDNSTTYFWQVTAMKDGNVFSQSDVNTFTTVAPGVEPVPPVQVTTYPPAEPAGTPAWVWVVIGIGAVLVIVVIVLIFRTRRV